MAITFPAHGDTPSRTIFEGAVLCTRERNGYHDSDFYAVVWDAKKKELRDVQYDTTRFAGGGTAHVDATDEVKAYARKWLARWAFRVLKSQMIRDAKAVEDGKLVRVVAGRKVEIGTEGVVFWEQRQTYGRYGSASATKIGIRTSDRKEKITKVGRRGKKYTVSRWADVEWTYAHNVEVVDPEQYHVSDSTLRRRAKKAAERMEWHHPFVAPGYVSM